MNANKDMHPMQRTAVSTMLLLAVLAAPAWGQRVRQISAADPVDQPIRYGIAADLETYPQAHPQQTIRSVMKASLAGHLDYMMAQLLAPSQVDAKLKGNAAAMRRLTSKSTAEGRRRISAALGRHIEAGTWLVTRRRAWAQTEGLPDLSLEKIGDRWYMHNVAEPMPRR
jgi:hypothetical protein